MQPPAHLAGPRRPQPATCGTATVISALVRTFVDPERPEGAGEEVLDVAEDAVGQPGLEEEGQGRPHGPGQRPQRQAVLPLDLGTTGEGQARVRAARRSDGPAQHWWFPLQPPQKGPRRRPPTPHARVAGGTQARQGRLTYRLEDVSQLLRLLRVLHGLRVRHRPGDYRQERVYRVFGPPLSRQRLVGGTTVSSKTGGRELGARPGAAAPRVLGQLRCSNAAGGWLTHRRHQVRAACRHQRRGNSHGHCGAGPAPHRLGAGGSVYRIRRVF